MRSPSEPLQLRDFASVHLGPVKVALNRSTCLGRVRFRQPRRTREGAFEEAEKDTDAWAQIASVLVENVDRLLHPVLVLGEQGHQAARLQIGADVELREPHDPAPCEGKGEQHVALVGHDAAAGISTAVRSVPRARPPVPFGRHREVQTFVLVEFGR